MVLHGTSADAKDIGDFCMGVTEAMRQYDGDTLMFGQVGEGLLQLRFDVRKARGLGCERDEPRLPGTGLALTNPIQIPGWFLHGEDPVEVFPRIGEGLGGGFTATLRTVSSDERNTEWTFDLRNQRLELSLGVADGP